MKAGYFLTLAIILFGVVILGMRNNNITVNDMKMELAERDRAGEDVRDEVEGELREYAFSRMNADVHIMLEGQYERAVAEANSRLDASVDSSIYEEAVAACDRENQPATENAECVQNYVGEQLDPEGVQVATPQREEFSYTYYSPAWTLDVPGIALVGALASSLVAFLLYLRDTFRSLAQKKTRE